MGNGIQAIKNLKIEYLSILFFRQGDVFPQNLCQTIIGLLTKRFLISKRVKMNFIKLKVICKIIIKRSDITIYFMVK